MVAIIKTDKGNMKVEFYPDVAPNTVLNFVTLAKKGFYDNLIFHRVVPGFVIQGGDPSGNGTGGPGYSIPAEFNSKKHRRGSLAMARSQNPDSAGSQFYICLADQPGLDGDYTVFGKVLEGESVIDDIEQGDRIKTVVVEGDLPKELQNRQIQKSSIR